MSDAGRLTGDELFTQYYPVTAKVKLKTCIRKALVVTGIYGLAKKYLNRVRGR